MGLHSLWELNISRSPNRLCRGSFRPTGSLTETMLERIMIAQPPSVKPRQQHTNLPMDGLSGYFPLSTTSEQMGTQDIYIGALDIWNLSKSAFATICDTWPIENIHKNREACHLGRLLCFLKVVTFYRFSFLSASIRFCFFNFCTA